MPKKETAAHARALKTARMWNQRAREKENRMQKQGITNVRDVSPRIAPSALPSMSTRELQQYAHRLNQFVSERFTPLPSGEVVATSEARALKRDLRRENRRRAEMRDALSKVDFPHARTFEERQAEWRQIDPITLKPTASARGTGSPIEQLYMTEPPQTLSAFRRRRESIHAMSIEPVAWRVARQRRSAVAMAQQTGNERLAADLLRASTFQLQYMVERMGLLDRLSMLYTSSEDMDAGRVSIRELMEEYDNGSYDQEVDSVADMVAEVIRNLRA